MIVQPAADKTGGLDSGSSPDYAVTGTARLMEARRDEPAG